MRIVAQISGDLRAMLDDATSGVADAVTAGMNRAAERVQSDLRGQVRASGLGSGLEKAWQKTVYPIGKSSTRPAGLVYSKSTVLHAAFIDGAVITAKRSRFLAIPTQQAIAMGFGTTTTSRKGGAVPGGQLRRSAQVEQAIQSLGEKNIHIVPIVRGRFLMLYKPPGTRQAKNQAVPLFILLPQVRLAPRLDLAGAESRAEDYLNTEIADALAQGGG